MNDGVSVRHVRDMMCGNVTFRVATAARVRGGFMRIEEGHDFDVWLPLPTRALHDEPITIEVWERRQRARREAEAMIAERFEQES